MKLEIKPKMACQKRIRNSILEKIFFPEYIPGKIFFLRLDAEKAAIGVFVDLQRAFNIRSITKLNHYGTRGIVYQKSSYLSSRHQFVSIGNTKSVLCPICLGVLQGTLLFCALYNNLHSCLKFSGATHFADDTNLIQIGSTIES